MILMHLIVTIFDSCNNTSLVISKDRNLLTFKWIFAFARTSDSVHPFDIYGRNVIQVFNVQTIGCDCIPNELFPSYRNFSIDVEKVKYKFQTPYISLMKNNHVKISDPVCER